MDKKLIFFILGSIIIVPILINLLMSVSVFPHVIPVKGDYQIWEPVLGTFWGAILGGVISGMITLYGVKKSIEASFRGLEFSAIKQNEVREKDIELATSKERLKELYQPIDNLFLEYAYKHGAHNFQDLTEKEQIDFILLLNKGLIYADSKLFKKSIELQWTHKAKDYTYANEFYNEVQTIVSDEIKNLRAQLKLPKFN